MLNLMNIVLRNKVTMDKTDFRMKFKVVKNKLGDFS